MYEMDLLSLVYKELNSAKHGPGHTSLSVRAIIDAMDSFWHAYDAESPHELFLEGLLPARAAVAECRMDGYRKIALDAREEYTRRYYIDSVPGRVVAREEYTRETLHNTPVIRPVHSPQPHSAHDNWGFAKKTMERDARLRDTMYDSDTRHADYHHEYCDKLVNLILVMWPYYINHKHGIMMSQMSQEQMSDIVARRRMLITMRKKEQAAAAAAAASERAAREALILPVKLSLPVARANPFVMYPG